MSENERRDRVRSAARGMRQRAALSMGEVGRRTAIGVVRYSQWEAGKIPLMEFEVISIFVELGFAVSGVGGDDE